MQGELVFVGGGDEADYEGVDVEGKIALIQETGLGYARFWMGTFAEIAARKGAVGIVVIHPLPWPYRMSMEAGNGKLENRFCAEQLPTVCVSGIDGGRLMHSIGAREAEAVIVVESEMPEVTSWNVSGVLRGSEWPDECILVHAHRDHGIYPGANDNGSGLGTMLEVANALAGSAPRRSIEFLCTTAEEGVDERDRRLHRGPGAGRLARPDPGCDRPRHVRRRRQAEARRARAVARLRADPAHRVADAVDRARRRRARVRRRADDGHVGRRGVRPPDRGRRPAAWFWRPDDFYYHSVHDDVDKLDGNTLKAVADITATALWQLADADDLPRGI